MLDLTLSNLAASHVQVIRTNQDLLRIALHGWLHKWKQRLHWARAEKALNRPDDVVLQDAVVLAQRPKFRHVDRLMRQKMLVVFKSLLRIDKCRLAPYGDL